MQLSFVQKRMLISRVDIMLEMGNSVVDACALINASVSDYYKYKRIYERCGILALASNDDRCYSDLKSELEL